MNTVQQTARVGLFFLLGVALVWITYETLSGGRLFKSRGYSVVAGYSDLQNLKVSDEVKMAGVKIGVVEQTRLANGRAEAVLRIDPGVKIPSDAAAEIVMAGLIGTNYINVDLGSPEAPPLADGAEIHTRTSPNINTIMTQLSDLGKKLQESLGSFSSAMTGNGKPGGGFIQKLDQLVTDNREKVGATLTNLQDITTKINQGQGTLGKLVNDPQLHDELLATVDQIKAAAGQAKDFVANAQSMIDQVKSGKGSLGVLIYDQQAADNIKASVQNIRDVSDKLAKGEGTLGKLINDDSLYTSAKGTLKKADRAIDSMGDSGPITAVGIIANSLF